jgi:hypothetical protein
MLAEIFMLWLEARRIPARTTIPSTSPFVPFSGGVASFKEALRSR